MTSEEQIAGLRQMSENGMLYGPGTRRALALAADTIERLERENAEAERLLKMCETYLHGRSDIDFQVEVGAYLARASRTVEAGGGRAAVSDER